MRYLYWERRERDIYIGREKKIEIFILEEKKDRDIYIGREKEKTKCAKCEINNHYLFFRLRLRSNIVSFVLRNRRQRSNAGRQSVGNGTPLKRSRTE